MKCRESYLCHSQMTTPCSKSQDKHISIDDFVSSYHPSHKHCYCLGSSISLNTYGRRGNYLSRYIMYQGREVLEGVLTFFWCLVFGPMYPIRMNMDALTKTGKHKLILLSGDVGCLWAHLFLVQGCPKSYNYPSGD